MLQNLLSCTKQTGTRPKMKGLPVLQVRNPGQEITIFAKKPVNNYNISDKYKSNYHLK